MSPQNNKTINSLVVTLIFLSPVIRKETSSSEANEMNKFILSSEVIAKLKRVAMPTPNRKYEALISLILLKYKIPKTKSVSNAKQSDK